MTRAQPGQAGEGRPWRTGLVLLAVFAVLFLIGARLLIGTGQRVDCGASQSHAFMLSFQAFGAAPSPEECGSLAGSGAGP